MGNNRGGKEGAVFSETVSCLSKNVWEGGEGGGGGERMEGDGGEGRK